MHGIYGQVCRRMYSVIVLRLQVERNITAVPESRCQFLVLQQFCSRIILAFCLDGDVSCEHSDPNNFCVNRRNYCISCRIYFPCAFFERPCEKFVECAEAVCGLFRLADVDTIMPAEQHYGGCKEGFRPSDICQNAEEKRKARLRNEKQGINSSLSQ